jgi:hypothetical protein
MGEYLASFGHLGKPQSHNAVGWQMKDIPTIKRTWPLVFFRRPEMAFKRVDLPAPLAPIMETTCPWSTFRQTASSAVILP